MRKLDLISEAQFWAQFEEIKVLHQKLSESILPLRREDILTEQEVCEILRVSPRTMLRYRKREYFHYIKLEGTVLYHNVVLYYDLLALCKINHAVINHSALNHPVLNHPVLPQAE